MNRVIIFPYKMTSQSAKRLSEELQKRGHKAMRVFPDKDYVPKRGDLIINYGSGHFPNWWNKTTGIPVLNHPDNCCLAINKISTFEALLKANVPTVPWTTSERTAYSWCKTAPSPSLMGFARTHVEGADGSGILPIYHGTEYSHEGEMWPRAPLYTQFVESEMEYRVHVWNGCAIIAQEKHPDGSATSNIIRTSGNNWAFCRPRSPVPEEILEASVRAVEALGLDFGGVDILWTGRDAAVLEVNTAPEIVGTDVTTYADCIEQML